MTFQQIVDEMARRSRRPRRECERAARDFVEAMRTGLNTDGEVAISGFGTLAYQQLSNRVAQNFTTGERIQVSGKRVVRFTASKRIATGALTKWDVRQRQPSEVGRPHAARLSDAATSAADAAG